jgi:DegV family protein with EDD domain
MTSSSPVRIVTDSTADLPRELIERYGITVVPLSVLFGDEELLDGIDITAEQFFRRLVREEQTPTTSQPSPALFHEAYERLSREGAREILSIHISAKLSGTLKAAVQGAEGIEGVRFRHVDSGTVSLALGLGVLAAAGAAAAGRTLEECRGVVEDVFRRTHLFFVVDTLEYLRRGGRLSRGQELVGTLLKVKPILTIENGEVVPLGRVRTRQKALEDLIRRLSDVRPIEHAAAIHATTPEDLEYVANRLRGLAPDADVVTSRIGPVVGVHAGPGLIGAAVVTKGAGSSPGYPAGAPREGVSGG